MRVIHQFAQVIDSLKVLCFLLVCLSDCERGRIPLVFYDVVNKYYLIIEFYFSDLLTDLELYFLNFECNH